MAEKKSGISYEQIIKDLKARKFAPVYVLMGDESFYIDKICDFISEMCLNRKSRTSIKPWFLALMSMLCRWLICAKVIR